MPTQAENDFLDERMLDHQGDGTVEGCTAGDGGCTKRKLAEFAMGRVPAEQIPAVNRHLHLSNACRLFVENVGTVRSLR